MIINLSQDFSQIGPLVTWLCARDCFSIRHWEPFSGCTWVYHYDYPKIYGRSQTT